MKIKTCGLLAALVVLLAGNIHATPIARLTLQSQPGDFIGQGGTFDITYTPGNGLLGFSAQITNKLQDGSPGEVLFLLGSVTQQTNTFAILIFSTEELGIPMQPGIYTNAEKSAAADPGHPGLDIEFQNRGCNSELPVSNIGSFVVTDASFDIGPPPVRSTIISSFSTSFEFHCAGFTGSLFGTFTYNANATEVPEPADYWLVGVGMVCLSFMRLQRRSGPYCYSRGSRPLQLLALRR